MKKYIIIISLMLAMSNLSCSVYDTLVNISRVKFKLGKVDNFSLNGIQISNKQKLSDFSTMDILNFSSAVLQGKLPVSFMLNVEAKNPNDGTGGYKSTGATLKSFPWRLLIDNKEAISGNIASAVSVPGTGETTIIKLQMNVDLIQLFKNQGYESLVNLALNIGGRGGSSSKLTLFAKPVVSTVIGDLSYPGELKIVDYEFSN
ncbi:MAG: hypothetical protein K8H86_14345 [Ignavibacteriaceae bacterium]|nr:hypothetical protein [Ignavibacteriaceae bacterium]